MIQEFKKRLGLWLYPQSKRLGDNVEKNLQLLELQKTLSDSTAKNKETFEKMKLHRNLFNINLISIENVDVDLRHEMEINCNSFMAKQSTDVLFRHVLAWYVNDSLFDNGKDINDDFFRGTINGIQMIRQFLDDQSTSYDNRKKVK